MKVLTNYNVESEGVIAEIEITQEEREFTNKYYLKHVKIKPATEAVLEHLKEKIIESIDIKTSEILDPRENDKVKIKLADRASTLIEEQLPGVSEEEKRILVGKIINDMTGLGDLELVLNDDNLEEVVINSSHEPVKVYHKKYGWLSTNITVSSEEQIYNYSSIIARKIGKQITNLQPMMDAHLLNGSRVNSVLFPINNKGNSLTIRKFSKDPWTIVNLISPDYKTITSEVAALIWTSMQYEMSILIGGGTASGKTSFLNAILPFVPANNRVISIEDSVKGSEKIIFQKGEVFYERMIGDLVEGQLSKDKTILEDGTEIALNINDEIRVFSSSKDGAVVLTQPTAFIKHRIAKNIVEIKTEKTIISVTEDHSVFIMKDFLTPVRAGDLKEGDEICIAMIATENLSLTGSMQLKIQGRVQAQTSKIIGISKNFYEGSVYDLTVPLYENFVCSNVIVHNTRELVLPDFMHWVPMVTREPNPEGKGEITMLDLVVNSLRMRPDRIVLGEVRRREEAEVLFEAMHTGHSVYSTVHADEVLQVKNRLLNPPISLPEEVLGALQLIIVQYRQRRTGIRRTYEVAEITPEENKMNLNVIYKWNARDDSLDRVGNFIRLIDELTMHTGMTINEIEEDISEKKKILDFALEHKIDKVNNIGALIAEYYKNRDELLDTVSKNKVPEWLK
ncbi:MAG: Flp pilus assembly complex ATPase component TadA [Candidatus Marsarchaeota archaeon]|nr:Flp pilus assembly complex ATPase component TadA [Candidatus Marsarchaeota archaeon]